MTLPASGAISALNLRNEIYDSNDLELNDAKLRKLINVFPTGPVPMGSFRGITYHSDSSWVFSLFSGTGTTAMSLNSMEIDSTGAMYFCSGSQLHKYTQQGAWVWSKNIPGPVFSPVGTDYRNLIVAGPDLFKIASRNVNSTSGAGNGYILPFDIDGVVDTANIKKTQASGSGFKVLSSLPNGDYLLEAQQYDMALDPALYTGGTTLIKMSSLTNNGLWRHAVTFIPLSLSMKLRATGIDTSIVYAVAGGDSNSYYTSSHTLVVCDANSGAVTTKTCFYITSYPAGTNTTFSGTVSCDYPLQADATGVYVILRGTNVDRAVGLVKLDLQGNVLWTAMFARESAAAAYQSAGFIVDTASNTVILCYADGPSTAYIHKFVWLAADTGAVQRSKTYSRIKPYANNSTNVQLKSIRKDPSGFGALFAFSGIEVFKVSYDGNILSNPSSGVTVANAGITALPLTAGSAPSALGPVVQQSAITFLSGAIAATTAVGRYSDSLTNI